MDTKNTTTTTPPVKYLSRLSVADKTNLILHVWGTMAPENKFAGMSLNEFRLATAPSLDTREQLLILHATRKGSVAKRNAADKATQALHVAVASGVKADPAHGQNSSLYRAMGFVTASERKKPGSASSVASATSATTNEATPAPIPTKSKHDLVERSNRFIDAWNQFGVESTFGGLTLAGFTAAVAPSRTLREEMVKDQINIKGTIALKNSADQTTSKLIQRVVSGIKADGEFGADSALYRALGYVTSSERRSGKRSKGAAPVTASPVNTLSPTAPTAPTTALPSTAAKS